MEKDNEKKPGILINNADPKKNYGSFYNKNVYKNPEYPVSIFEVSLDQHHARSIRWHWHEEMEILVVRNGSVKVTTDDDKHILAQGEGLIINQNVMHSIHSIKGNPCTYYSLIFHPDLLFGTNSYLRTAFLFPMQGFSVLKTMPLKREIAWHNGMLDLLNKVFIDNLTQKFGYQLATKGYLCQLWATLLSRIPQADIPRSSNVSLNEQRVKKAMLFIRLHHAEALSLDDIAESISVSKSECCRCFKATIQMTPFEYLMRYRIFEASKQILNGYSDSHSIADLALSVGFNNISYFNKLFKRYLDCTPTEYKNRVSDSASVVKSEPFAIPFSR